MKLKLIDTSYVIGLPITFSGLIYPILYFLRASPIVVVAVTFVIAALMVSAIKIPKI